MSVEPGHTSGDHTKMDGSPDHRFKEHGGGEHGNQGGRETGFTEEGNGTSSLVTEGSSGVNYQPSANDGNKQDGTPDKRMSSEHGFGGEGGADPHEAGKKGGSASYENDGLTH